MRDDDDKPQAHELGLRGFRDAGFENEPLKGPGGSEAWCLACG